MSLDIITEDDMALWPETAQALLRLTERPMGLGPPLTEVECAQLRLAVKMGNFLHESIELNVITRFGT